MSKEEITSGGATHNKAPHHSCMPVTMADRQLPLGRPSHTRPDPSPKRFKASTHKKLPLTLAVSSMSLTCATGEDSHSAPLQMADRKLPPGRYSHTSAGERMAPLSDAARCMPAGGEGQQVECQKRHQQVEVSGLGAGG